MCTEQFEGDSMNKLDAIKALQRYGITTTTSSYVVKGKVNSLDTPAASELLLAYCTLNTKRVYPMTGYIPASIWTGGKQLPKNLKDNNRIYILEEATRVYMNVRYFLMDQQSTRAGFKVLLAGKQKKKMADESWYIFFNTTTNMYTLPVTLGRIGDCAFCPTPWLVRKLVPGNFLKLPSELGFKFMTKGTYLWIVGTGEFQRGNKTPGNLPSVFPAKVGTWNKDTKKYDMGMPYTLSDFNTKRIPYVGVYQEDPELANAEELAREAGFEVLHAGDKFDAMTYRITTKHEGSTLDDILDLDVYVDYFMVLVSKKKPELANLSKTEAKKLLAGYCEANHISYIIEGVVKQV